MSEDDKKFMGEYLQLKDRQLLCTRNMGLSEKLLIIKRQGSEWKSHIDICEIFDMDGIGTKIAAINEKYNKIRKLQQCLTNNIKPASR